MRKSLQKSDNYCFIVANNQVNCVLVIDGVCYKAEYDDTLVPIAYGDEVVKLYGGKTAIRQGQKVKII